MKNDKKTIGVTSRDLSAVFGCRRPRFVVNRFLLFEIIVDVSKADDKDKKRVKKKLSSSRLRASKNGRNSSLNLLLFLVSWSLYHLFFSNAFSPSHLLLIASMPFSFFQKLRRRKHDGAVFTLRTLLL